MVGWVGWWVGGEVWKLEVGVVVFGRVLRSGIQGDVGGVLVLVLIVVAFCSLPGRLGDGG